MSAHVSSGGASGVTSIATASVGTGASEEDASGFFSESLGGLLGGGAEDIGRMRREDNGEIQLFEMTDACSRTRVPISL